MNENQPANGMRQEASQTVPAAQPVISNPLPWLIRNLIRRQGEEAAATDRSGVPPKPTNS